MRKRLSAGLVGLPSFALLVFCASGVALDKNSAAHSAPGISSAVPIEETLVLSDSESRNPRTYDPATTHGSGDRLAFSGLVSLDPALNLSNDLAESWQVDAAGTTYTFRLRPNARFHDGRVVTAQDVIYSWERAASQALASDTVLTYLGDIVGVREMAAGQAERVRGLEALDNRSLRVTIDAPKPYFLLKLTYPTAFVVDHANVESGSEWFRHPNGTGPFRMVEWRSFEHIRYERNEAFYLGAPAIRAVLVLLNAGEDVRLYENGEIDLASVGPGDAERFLESTEPLTRELLRGVSLCTGYVVFDATRPPFDDVAIRKAFSMAFDRATYITLLLAGQALPAVGPYPPGLPGYNRDLAGLPFDAAAARRLLESSRYGGPQSLPPIVYTAGGIGNSISPSVPRWRRCGSATSGVTSLSKM
jgi:ABC-type transport system substrate-binding protein